MASSQLVFKSNKRSREDDNEELNTPTYYKRRALERKTKTGALQSIFEMNVGDLSDVDFSDGSEIEFCLDDDYESTSSESQFSSPDKSPAEAANSKHSPMCGDQSVAVSKIYYVTRRESLSDGSKQSSEIDFHGNSDSGDVTELNDDYRLENPNSSDSIQTVSSIQTTCSIKSNQSETEIEYDFVVSGKRRNSQLLWSITETMFYKLNSKGKNAQYYVCYINSCKARLLLKSNGICVKRSGEHNHGTHQDLYRQFEGENQVKELCLKDRSSKSTKEIYEEVLHKCQDLEKPYSKMQRNLRLLRAKGLPKSPLDCTEIETAFGRKDVMERFGYSNHNSMKEKFFHGTYEEKSFSFCVFASINIINRIRELVEVENLTILIDATFKVVPMSCFNQLLIIYAQYNSKIYPMVYVLMSKKSQACYLAVFKYIEQNVCSLECSNFITDYERAMKNALREIHPNAEMTSCWFHFCQAVRKHMTQDPNLFELIRKDDRAAILYRQFQCLPLLPEKEIETTFKKLKKMALAYNSKAFAKFLSYYKKQWILAEGPESICVYKKETRTTCAVEANNGVLGKKWKSHAAFFVFLESLQREEFSKSTQLLQDMRIIDTTKRRRERNDRFNRIKKATKEFSKGIITSIQFLDKISNLNNKIMKEESTELDPSKIDQSASSSSDSESDEGDECNPVCMKCNKSKPTILLLPCTHCCLCGNCWRIISDRSKRNDNVAKCPRKDCKKVVKKISEVDY